MHWWTKRIVLAATVIFASFSSGMTQEQETDYIPLAPAIPLNNEVIEELVLREIPLGETAGISSRFIRLGEAGSLRRPGSLDIPREGSTGIQPYRFDWVRTVDRTLEIRQRGSFARLARLEPHSQGVLLSADRIELLDGELIIDRDGTDAIPLSVSIENVEVYGRGIAHIVRENTGVSVSVRAGQFDIYRDGSLVALLGAGNSRSFPIGSAAFDDLVSSLREALSEIIIGVRAGESVDGDTLSHLWTVSRSVAAQFAEKEQTYDPDISDPDIILFDIAEAFRMLGGYRFVPARALGM